MNNYLIFKRNIEYLDEIRRRSISIYMCIEKYFESVMRKWKTIQSIIFSKIESRH